jgi:hypothetical protein
VELRDEGAWLLPPPLPLPPLVLVCCVELRALEPWWLPSRLWRGLLLRARSRRPLRLSSRRRRASGLALRARRRRESRSRLRLRSCSREPSRLSSRRRRVLELCSRLRLRSRGPLRLLSRRRGLRLSRRVLLAGLRARARGPRPSLSSAGGAWLASSRGFLDLCLLGAASGSASDAPASGRLPSLLGSVVGACSCCSGSLSSLELPVPLEDPPSLLPSLLALPLGLPSSLLEPWPSSDAAASSSLAALWWGQARTLY